MKRLLFLCITFSMLLGFVACIEPERRPYYNDSYGDYDRADRYDIEARINNQQRRIDQGISSGELTRREADVLIDNLNWIRDEYSLAKKDGRLSQSEIGRLSEHLDQNNRMIRDKKNNEIRRVYSAPPPPPQAPFVRTPAPRHEQRGNNFEERINNQMMRIVQGTARGDFTQREAEMLQENLNHIKDDYSRLKADGRLSQKEQDRLDMKLDRNDRMINNKKHNLIERFN